VKVYACDLTDLGSCLSGTTNPYVAGQQDAVYDSTHGLAYRPVAACCHDDNWNSQFHAGYDSQWNAYQSQSTHQSANINVENSPGAVVSVGQTSNQNQVPQTCSDNLPCENSNPCNDSCGPTVAPYGFHHFGWHEGCGFGCSGGFGYRHIFWHGVLEYQDRRIKSIVCCMTSGGFLLGAWDYLRWKHVTPMYYSKGEIIAAKVIIYAEEVDEYSPQSALVCKRGDL